jgi:hypothetical protein
VIEFLDRRRRTLPETDRVLAREFSQAITASRFAAIYRDAIRDAA